MPRNDQPSLRAKLLYLAVAATALMAIATGIYALVERGTFAPATGKP